MWVEFCGFTADLLHIFECVGKESVYTCYSNYDAFSVGLFIAFCIAMFCFVWSIIGNNCSKVDQLWSIVPVVYCWHFYYHHLVIYSKSHNKLLLLATLVTFWGARLTFNFWRKGGYGNLITHEEDYRWPILRKKMSKPLFLLFNFSFIAIYQNLLLYLIACPAYIVMRNADAILADDLMYGTNLFDRLSARSLAAAFSVLLLMESVADEQHFQFQTLKHSLSADERAAHSDPDIRVGFFRSGLFRYSRHPNYFAEQAMWVCVYLFSVTPLYAPWLNWSVAGCLQLILLFQGSMSFGESITASKYPLYREYQRTTPQCIPGWGRQQQQESSGAAETSERKKQL